MITINSTAYDVGTAEISRSIRRDEKYRVVTEDGTIHRETRATYLDFDLTLGNVNKTAYDSLMTALLAADGEVTITLPSSSGSTATYTGIFDGVTDRVICDDGTTVTWDTLTLAFTGTREVNT